MQLAGTIELRAVVDRLRVLRPVFHSEADFQHAFAWVAHELEGDLQVRPETHPEPGVRLDLMLSRPDLDRCTAVELKYLTAAWEGKVGEERFGLKTRCPGCAGVRRRQGPGARGPVRSRTTWLDGLVLALSNDPSYWTSPWHMRETNAEAFRLYDGHLVHGVRAWGPRRGAGTRKGREAALSLRGAYRCEWSDYANLSGSRRSSGC